MGWIPGELQVQRPVLWVFVEYPLVWRPSFEKFEQIWRGWMDTFRTLEVYTLSTGVGEQRNRAEKFLISLLREHMLPEDVSIFYHFRCRVHALSQKSFRTKGTLEEGTWPPSTGACTYCSPCLFPHPSIRSEQWSYGDKELQDFTNISSFRTLE
jgi:hypothetical protein